MCQWGSRSQTVAGCWRTHGVIKVQVGTCCGVGKGAQAGELADLSKILGATSDHN